MTIRNGTGSQLHVKAGTMLADLRAGLELLADQEVLVGFPESTATEGRDAAEPTNPQLGYIHDNGAPEANIPQREFMRPGIESERDQLEGKLAQTMRAVVLKGGGPAVAEQGLMQTGILAVVAIKKKLSDGVPPPLSDYTLRQRLKKGRKGGGGARTGAQQELDSRAAGNAPSTEFAKPLIDTAAMQGAVNYAVRSRKERKS